MVEVEVQFEYISAQNDELTIKKGDIIKNVKQMEGGWWEGDLNGKRGMFPDNFVKVLNKDAKQTGTSSSVSNSNVNFRKDKKRKCRVLFSYQPANEDELRLEVNDVIDVLDEVEEGWWSGIVRGKSGVFPSNFVEEIPGTETEKTPLPSAPQPPQPSEKLVPAEADAIKPRPVKGIGYGNIFQDGMVKLKPASSAPSQEPKSAVPPKKPPFPNIAANADAPQLPPKPAKELAKVLYCYEALNDDELSVKEGDIITVLSKDVDDVGWWKGELNGRVGVFPDNFVEVIVEDNKVKKSEKPEKSAPNATALKASIRHDRDSTDGVTASKDSESSIPKGLHAKRPPPDPKKDDKAEKPDKPGPPLPSKKPQLPPPLKRISQLSAAFGQSVPAVAPVPQPPTVDVGEAKPRQSQQPAKQDKNSNDVGFDGVESSEKLVHLTANRARNPNRRPPSHVFLKGDNEKSNGDVENEVTNPWKQELRKNQIKRRSQANHDVPLSQDTILEVDEKHLPKSSSTKPVEDENSNSKLSLGSVASAAAPTSPSRFKSTNNGDITDAKGIKLEKTGPESSTSLPALSTEPTLTELAKLSKSLLENMVTVSEFNELRNGYLELQNAFDSYKLSTTRTIAELSREVQLERNHRQALEQDVEKLKLSLSTK